MGKHFLEEIIELNDILNNLISANQDLYDFAEQSNRIPLKKLAYDTIVKVGTLIQDNSLFLIDYLKSEEQKEKDNLEFEKLMQQLEDKTSEK